jgi:hypothetical protein
MNGKKYQNTKEVKTAFGKIGFILKKDDELGDFLFDDIGNETGWFFETSSQKEKETFYLYLFNVANKQIFFELDNCPIIYVPEKKSVQIRHSSFTILFDKKNKRGVILQDAPERHI